MTVKKKRPKPNWFRALLYFTQLFYICGVESLAGVAGVSDEVTLQVEIPKGI